MKKFLIFFFLFWFVFTSKVNAVPDLSITCNNNACQLSSLGPVFNFQNIYPGYLIQKNVEIINNRSDNCNLNFSFINKNNQENILPSKINFSIVKGSHVLYSGTLQDLYQKGQFYIDNLKGGEAFNYVWQVYFSEDADNSFKNLKSNFNINFNFVCQDTPPSNGSPENNNTSNPVCTQSVPDAPTNFYTRRNSTGSVTLFWKHPTTPFTNYLIAYGTSPGVYLYGNPNVGNDDHYTVRSLTYGAQYCFYVRTINGCMPGGKTNEVCINTGSSVVANINPPAGFQPDVLGAETQSTLPDDSSSPTVAGANNKNNKQIIFYILFFLFILVGVSHILKYFHKFKTG